MDFITITNVDDIKSSGADEKIAKNLESFLEEYSQFAYDPITGNILAAVVKKDGTLRINCVVENVDWKETFEEEQKKTGKRIPISAVKKIADEFGYSQVIIHAHDTKSNIQSVATYGKTVEDCANAAEGGNAIKKLLNWPENLCNAKPSRIKKAEKNGFLSGYMTGLQFIVISHGLDSIAEDMIMEGGFTKEELIKEQKKSGFENEQMIKVINEAFRRKALKK